MCTATKYKMNRHVKTCFGLKYEKALYQVMNDNLVHPIPICHKKKLSSQAYLLLAESEITITEACTLCSTITTDDKESNDNTVYTLLKIKNPNAGLNKEDSE
jgi:hypothetical protein